MRYLKTLVAVVAVCALALIIVFLTNKEQHEPIVSEEPTPVTEQENSPQTSVESEAAQDNSPPLEEVNGHSIDDTLREILLAAKEFYDESNETTVITQQNGVLYHGPADIPVTTAYLITRDYLPEDYALEGAEILYLSSSDVVKVIPSFSEADSVYTLYVSVPYEGGYLVYSRGEPVEKISKEQYNQLLKPYLKDNGIITRITASSPEYAEINRLLKEYEQTESDFYVRYGMRNDKYAVIIASPKNDFRKIIMYVLMFRDEKWEIKLPNLESVERPNAVILNVCHDFDLELMPDYNIDSAIDSLDNSPTEITPILINSGQLVEGETELEYLSKGSNFLFAKYKNGRLFVGTNSGDGWVLTEVDSALSASDYLLEFDSSIPDLMIIWE